MVWGHVRAHQAAVASIRFEEGGGGIAIIHTHASAQARTNPHNYIHITHTCTRTFLDVLNIGIITGGQS